MALPQSEMALLQPSTTLGTSKKSKKQILREILRQKQLGIGSDFEKSVKTFDPVSEAGGDDANLLGTTWRKTRRKRRKLKVEKVLLDSKPPPSVPSREASEDESSDTELEESDHSLEGMHVCAKRAYSL